MPVSITEVTCKADLERFIRLPWKIYAQCPCWVPPLLSERRAFLNPAKNPFFEHAEVRLFMAHNHKGDSLGRIAGIINHNHNAVHCDGMGFFGLFECQHHTEAASRLLDSVVGFLRAHGLKGVRGPVNMSVNDDIGLLVEGFDRPPFFMMPYNLPYYEPLLLSFGFKKAKDLFAYYGESTVPRIPERVIRGADLARRRYAFSVRRLDLKRFDDEVKKIHHVYTHAWEDNWGAVPMTEREFAHLAKDLRRIVDPDLCLIAEIQGNPVGFSLALPDFNQALMKLNGRLFPLGIFKLLLHSRKINALRIITMGVLKEYRQMGIDSVFYLETYRNAAKRGICRGEMSWILEDNAAMNNTLRNLNLHPYKKYRLYEYRL